MLFSDVRDFTTITDGDEQALVAQLNEYFNEMVNIVFRNRHLDKFIGDAVMAQWGGIVTEGKKRTPAMPWLAVEMRKTLVRLNADWVRRQIIDEIRHRHQPGPGHRESAATRRWRCARRRRRHRVVLWG